MALLEVKDVHTYYGNIHALKGISLEVNEGEVVCLMGGMGRAKQQPYGLSVVYSNLGKVKYGLRREPG